MFHAVCVTVCDACCLRQVCEYSSTSVERATARVCAKEGKGGQGERVCVCAVVCARCVCVCVCVCVRGATNEARAASGSARARVRVRVRPALPINNHSAAHLDEVRRRDMHLCLRRVRHRASHALWRPRPVQSA